MLRRALVAGARVQRGGRLAFAALIGVTLVAVTVRGQGLPANAIDRFWLATSDAERRIAAEAIVASHAPFSVVAAALRAGRRYSVDVPTGRQLRTRQNGDGLEHSYVVFIPESYVPSRSYPVRVYLHGGVMRPKRDDGGWWRNTDPLLRSDSFVVFPASWPDSIWWQTSQIENLAGLLNDLKRLYNVDEDRFYLLGMSDGATGAFYHAFKAPTPWAAFLPFHGHPGVLANPASGVDGQIHVTNLRNKPFFIVNGGKDQLYPLAAVAPYVQLFERAGVSVEFRPQPEAGHNMHWWPDVSPAIDAFVNSTPRQPLPDELSWQTEDTRVFNRIHWLVIDELGQADGDRELEPFNRLTRQVPDTQLGLSMVGELADRSGIQLLEVGAESIVDEAGIEVGDIIVAIDGKLTPDSDALREALLDFAPGDERPVVVRRQSQQLDLRLQYPMSFVTEARGAFENTRPSGRVDVSRDGNVVTAQTDNVRRYTLLLSSDQFDLSRPIRVVTNGVVSHDQTVTPSVETMLRWAAVDQDRSLLFAAELEIELPSP